VHQWEGFLCSSESARRILCAVLNWREGFLCSSGSARRILVQFWIGEKYSYAVVNLQAQTCCAVVNLWEGFLCSSESASSDLLCSTGICKQKLVLNVQSMNLQGTIVKERSLHAPRAAERRVLTIDSSRQCIVNDNEVRVVLQHLIHHLLSLIPIHNINLDSLDRELYVSPGSTTSRYTFGNQLKTCCYGCFRHRLTHLPCAAIHLIHLVSKAFSHEEHRKPSLITTQYSKPRPRKPRSSLNPSKTPVLNPTKTSKAKRNVPWLIQWGGGGGGSHHCCYQRKKLWRPSCIPSSYSSSSSSSSSSCAAAPSQEEKKHSTSPPWTRLACLAPRRRSRQRRSFVCGGGNAWVAKARDCNWR